MPRSHDDEAANGAVSRPGQVVDSPRSLLIVLVLSVVLFQRIGVPLGGFGQVPVALLAPLTLLGYGLASGLVVPDRTRMRLYVTGTGTLVLLTLIALARGQRPSLLSVMFLVAIYAFATVRVPALTTADVEAVLDVVVRVMLIAGCVGLLQMAVQLLGVPYEDWPARAVPASILIEGYNTGDPIHYGSPYYRSNGIAFLEPSFLSYFLGLACVIALHRSRSMLVISVLLLSLLPTLAGNGVVVLLAGVAVMLLSKRRRRLKVLVPPVGLAVCLAVITPLGSTFVGRATEVSEQGSSSSLRLVEPYVRVMPATLDDLPALLLGAGAGAATDFLDSLGIDGLLAPVVPKLLMEYGVVGALLFLLFLLWCLCAGALTAERPWGVGLLFNYLLLNAALLQETIALTTIFFLVLLRTDREDPSLMYRGPAGPPEGAVEAP